MMNSDLTKGAWKTGVAQNTGLLGVAWKVVLEEAWNTVYFVATFDTGLLEAWNSNSEVVGTWEIEMSGLVNSDGDGEWKTEREWKSLMVAMNRIGKEEQNNAEIVKAINTEEEASCTAVMEDS